MEEITPDNAEEQPRDVEAHEADSFADIEMPEELEPRPASAPLPSFVDERLWAPALDRERPERPALVDRRVWVAVAVLGAIVVLAVAAWFIGESRRSVEVPNLIGVTLGVAETRSADIGLLIEVTERRFGPEDLDQVIEQDPPPGSAIRKGDTVRLIVSAGTEEFVMPDVVGDGLALAEGTLEGRGLSMQVETVVSEAASDTVLSTIPAAGAVVRTGDVVRVQIATPEVDSGGLQPYEMAAVSIIIDPSPVSSGTVDPALEVSRRLRALLEASGATVTMLRTGADTSTSDAIRAEKARTAAATFALGFTVREKAADGRAVLTPSTGNAAIDETARALGSSITSALAQAAPPARRRTAIADPVFDGLSSPWIRVELGGLDSRTDAASFADPRWYDEVARALYESLGEVFGRKATP